MQYNTGMDNRKKTNTVKVGDVNIGSDHPIVIQSMTSTPTSDVSKTLKQIIELSEAGSEIVRITINDQIAANAAVEIKNKLVQQGYNIPLVGDFHYNGHTLLRNNLETATILDKYRINPGNIGSSSKYDSNFESIINIAIDNDKPVRIGANWGSINKNVLNELIIDKENNKSSISYSDLIKNALIKSVLDSAKKAQQLGLPANKIILSCKTSDIATLVDIYRKLSDTDYPLHLGLTEAGMGKNGIISSTSALSILLFEGIGDTIRASLTPESDEDRVNEVNVCKDILSSLNLRKFKPRVVSCPGCGRTSSDYFIKLSKNINQLVDSKILEWKDAYPGVETMTIAVMGCIVNGPGESKHADIGISLPGDNEDPHAPVFIDGKKVKTLSGANIENDFIDILQDYIETRYKNP